MPDVVDQATRSRMMGGIRGSRTKPEMTVRRSLHRGGFRFRVNVRDLPGKPDIVLAKHRAAIFVHGCFWHRHPGCRYTTTPGTRISFWAEKFDANVQRDARAVEALHEAGWRVAVIWECTTRSWSEPDFEVLANWIRSDARSLTIERRDPAG